MGRIQRITVFLSVAAALALAAVLGIFLWTESREGSGNETQQGAALAEGEGTPEEDGGVPGEDTDLEGEEDGGEAPGEPEITDVTMVFTGDILLREAVTSRYDSGGLGSILSEHLQQEMREADITMVNQEFPFSTRGTPMPDKTYTFRVNPSYVGMFHAMGVDIVSLANNHALDYGVDALTDTFTTLEEAEIPYVGAGNDKARAEEAVFFERGGRKIGVLGASRVIPVVSWNIENRQPGLFCTYDSTALVAAIQRTKAQCDYVVVYVHWGIERQNYPEAYQRNLAQAYIEAGADLVVGSHPHVPQGIEYYQEKPIVYSLGNFIFNSNMAKTYMLKVVWEAGGESRLCVIPVETTSYLTKNLEGQEAADMYQFLQEISYGVAIDGAGVVSVQP